ncbi:MAG: GNAT family N-acetyltransferase [Pseudomonadota bacterium]
MQQFKLEIGPPYFSNWPALHQLLVDSFAYMEGRIDPPSSLNRMSPETLREKSAEETLIIVWLDDVVVACGFLKETADTIYLGKLAVHEDMRGRGILRKIMAAAECFAEAQGKQALELQTRVELTENHQTFAALGFVQTGTTAHAGYDRPTSITMRKEL